MITKYSPFLFVCFNFQTCMVTVMSSFCCIYYNMTHYFCVSVGAVTSRQSIHYNSRCSPRTQCAMHQLCSCQTGEPRYTTAHSGRKLMGGDSSLGHCFLFNAKSCAEQAGRSCETERPIFSASSCEIVFSHCRIVDALYTDKNLRVMLCLCQGRIHWR